MFENFRHAANSEFETLGAASRMVLFGLELKRRAANAPENALKKDRMRGSAPGLVRDARREVAPRFTPISVKGRSGRVRE